MSPERFLAADAAPAPLDEEEIREAVWELLFARAPPALVRVVGKQVYHRCEGSAALLTHRCPRLLFWRSADEAPWQCLLKKLHSLNSSCQSVQQEMMWRAACTSTCRM